MAILKGDNTSLNSDAIRNARICSDKYKAPYYLITYLNGDREAFHGVREVFLSDTSYSEDSLLCESLRDFYFPEEKPPVITTTSHHSVWDCFNDENPLPQKPEALPPKELARMREVLSKLPPSDYDYLEEDF